MRETTVFTNMGSPEPDRPRRQLGFSSPLPYRPGLGDRGLRVGKKVGMGTLMLVHVTQRVCHMQIVCK